MKKRTLGAIAAALAVLAVILGVCAAAGSGGRTVRAALAEDMQIYCGEQSILPTGQAGRPLCPIIYEGNVYLPAQALEKALETKISWDESARKVELEPTVATGQRMLNVINFRDNDGLGLMSVNYTDLVKDELTINIGEREEKTECLLFNSDPTYTSVFHLTDDTGDKIADVTVPASGTVWEDIPAGVKWLTVACEMQSPELPEGGDMGGES